MLNGTFTIDGFKFPKSDVAFLETNLFNKCPHEFKKLFSQVRHVIQTLSLNDNVTIQAQFRHDDQTRDYFEGYAVSMDSCQIAFIELSACEDRNDNLPTGAGELQKVDVSAFRTWFDDAFQRHTNWTYRSLDKTKEYDVRDLRLVLTRLINETDGATALWALPTGMYKNPEDHQLLQVFGMVSRNDRPVKISFLAPIQSTITAAVDEAVQVRRAEQEIWSINKAA